LTAKRNHIRLLDPRSGKGLALRLHRQVREGKDGI
jgi:hypothetical protein